MEEPWELWRWRRPVGLVGGIGLPVILLVVFGELPSFQKAASTFGGLTAFDVYVPILLVFGLSAIALMGLPMSLVSHRQLGVLRRLSTTPVPPSWLLLFKRADRRPQQVQVRKPLLPQRKPSAATVPPAPGPTFPRYAIPLQNTA